MRTMARKTSWQRYLDETSTTPSAWSPRSKVRFPRELHQEARHAKMRGAPTPAEVAAPLLVESRFGAWLDRASAMPPPPPPTEADSLSAIERKIAQWERYDRHLPTASGKRAAEVTAAREKARNAIEALKAEAVKLRAVVPETERQRTPEERALASAPVAPSVSVSVAPRPVDTPKPSRADAAAECRSVYDAIVGYLPFGNALRVDGEHPVVTAVMHVATGPMAHFGVDFYVGVARQMAHKAVAKIVRQRLST